MALETNPLELLGLAPDERLLAEDLAHLPASVGEPPAPEPESAARRVIVRGGAAMTGASLIGGVGLGLLAVGELLAGDGLAWLAVLAVGILLAATHWGWVHVAELVGNRMQARRDAELRERQRRWLREIEPYPRWEVATGVSEDGSIAIRTCRYRPVRRGERTYSFVCEEVARELHAAEEPAAQVAERAEALRRRAAADTGRARERYEIARDAYEGALLARDDEQQRLQALRAASQALSERLNAKLREPPLVE
jgi:hypothetical protein